VKLKDLDFNLTELMHGVQVQTSSGAGAYSRRSTLSQAEPSSSFNHSSSRPRFKREPTYPLPPISQFPLQGHRTGGGGGGGGGGRSKTPQNTDRRTPTLNGVNDFEAEAVDGGGRTDSPLRHQPAVLYADLQERDSTNGCV
jgi:hypothetical protein